MALTQQEQNFVSRVQQIADTLLEAQHEVQRLIAEWNQNDFFNQITDEDLGEIASFTHLTASELSNAVTAISAFNTALGDYSSGQAVNLIKLRG